MRQALLAGIAFALLLTLAPVASAGATTVLDDVRCPTCTVCPTSVSDWTLRPVPSAMACISGQP